MNKILLIGLGPHAKRIYFPIMQKWGKDFNAELECAVDLESKKEDIQNYLKDKGVNLSTYYLPDKEVNYNKLSDSVKVKIGLWQAIKFGLGFGLGLLFYVILITVLGGILVIPMIESPFI